MEHELDHPTGAGADSHGPELIQRTFEAEITPGEGRTIDVRIVPYGERATVADGLGGVARGIPYQEEWMPGVFDHQLRAANRVLANVEHEQGVNGIVGRGIALRSASDGFYGSFVALKTPAGDTALELVNEGCLDGVSLEARPRPKGSVRVGGVIQRVKADLRAIAFCRTPAFAGAQVLAVREQDIVIDETQLPVSMNPDLIDRCRRLGIRIPDQYASVQRAATAMPGPDSSAVASRVRAAMAELEQAAAGEIDAADKATLERMIETCRRFLAA